jgi:hypothetical protein
MLQVTTNAFSRVGAGVSRLAARSGAVARAAPAALARLASSSKKAAAAPPAPKSLAAVLDLELKYEKEEGAGSSDATLAEIQAELSDWKFELAPQVARFSLAKRFGAQDVRLDLDCTPMPADEEEPEEGAEEGAEGEAGERGGAKAGEDGEEEEDGEEAPPDGYRMLVTIKEPGKATTMQVGCFLGRNLRVHRVTLFPAGKEPSADVIFGGVRTARRARERPSARTPERGRARLRTRGAQAS